MANIFAPYGIQCLCLRWDLQRLEVLAQIPPAPNQIYKNLPEVLKSPPSPGYLTAEMAQAFQTLLNLNSGDARNILIQIHEKQPYYFWLRHPYDCDWENPVSQSQLQKLKQHLLRGISPDLSFLDGEILPMKTKVRRILQAGFHCLVLGTSFSTLRRQLAENQYPQWPGLLEEKFLRLLVELGGEWGHTFMKSQRIFSSFAIPSSLDPKHLEYQIKLSLQEALPLLNIIGNFEFLRWILTDLQQLEEWIPLN